MKELRYLNKYFVKYKYRFLLGIVITIVAQIFSLFTPKLISKSFKAIEEHSNGVVGNTLIKSQLIENSLLIVGTTTIAGVFNKIATY